MSEDLYAARLQDPLMHTSWIADLISTATKILTYVAIAAAAVAVVALVIGTGGAGAVVLGCVAKAAIGFAATMLAEEIAGDAIESMSDAVGNFFASPNKNGFISSGSPNTKTNSRWSARAAGSLPDEAMEAALEANKNPPEKPPLYARLWGKAKGLAKFAYNVSPVGLFNNRDKIATFVKNFDGDKALEALKHAGSELVNPTVTQAHPDAIPKDGDTVFCDKFPHGGEHFIAEGSLIVRINSQPATRKGDKSECGGVIEPEGNNNVRIWGPKIAVRNVKSGKNPIAVFAGTVLAAVLTAKGKQNLLCTLLGVVAEQVVSSIVSATITGVSYYSSEKPVHATMGSKCLSDELEQDFSVSGVMPLDWQRVYNSSNVSTGILGQGWSLPFEIGFRVNYSEEEPEAPVSVTYMGLAGREIETDYIPEGTTLFVSNEGFYLLHLTDGAGWVMTTVYGDSYFFAPYGDDGKYRLIQMADKNNNTLYLDYDEGGRVTALYDTHKDIHVTLHYYRARLASVEQHLTNGKQRTLVRYEYSDERQLIAVYKAGKVKTRAFAYGEHGLLTYHKDLNGLACHYEYSHLEVPEHFKETAWRVTRHWLTDTEKNVLDQYHFSYDLTQNITTVKSSAGTKYYHFDNDYQMTQYQDVMGNIHRFGYEENDVVLYQDPHNNDYHCGYDDRANLVSIKDPLGRTQLTTWHDAYALPTKEGDFEGNTTSYEYDDWGNLITVTDPKGHSTHYHHNELGLVTKITNANEQIIHQKWNNFGQLVSYRDCSGHETQIFYNEWGMPTTFEDAMSKHTDYVMDDLGLLQSLRRADGKKQTYTYDASLRLVHLIDFAGRNYRYQYNVYGQVVRYDNPKGDELHFEYDALGRLLALKNEKNEAYRFQYDALNRLIQQTDLSGIETAYHYSALNELLSLTQTPEKESDLSPITHQFHYDVISRLTEKHTAEKVASYHYPKGKTTVQRTTPEEWALAKVEARLPQFEDELTLEYDARGLLAAEVNDGGTFGYGYDPMGNLLSTKLPDGRSIENLYYGSGHLHHTSLIDEFNKHTLADYERDRLHREILRTQGKLQQTIDYNAVGRITAKTSRVQGLPEVFSPVIEKIFHYDQSDNLVKRTFSYGRQKVAFQQEKTERTTYYYDELDQVIGDYRKDEQIAYTYDKANNLFADGIREKQNRLTQYKNLKYSYDGFGRMLTREGHHGSEKQRFSYDSEHRLIKVEILNNPNVKAVEFTYDAIGRRTQKIVHSQYSQTPTKTTQFLWSGMRMIEERSKLMGENHSCVYIYNDQSYEPIARVERCNNDPTTDKVHYFHTNVNGCPEEMTNHDGDMVWQSESTLFGKIKREHLDEEETIFPQNLRFQGQYFDQETGLHYNTFRYYDPEIGRFTQQDPIGLAGGFNLYQYAPNTIDWIDPWGWDSTIVRYMNGQEAQSVIQAKGLVPNQTNKGITTNKAVWVNDGGAKWNPSGEKYRMVMKTNNDGTAILNKTQDISTVDWKETGLKDGVLTKKNEIGAKGIGRNKLDPLNKSATSIEIQTQDKKGNWKTCNKVL